ncbi:MAG: hypothetical protein IPN88_11265 [Bacteroidetes bacterium]|nr:hypothetical protein [Bacteroidota bacterium]
MKNKLLLTLLSIFIQANTNAQSTPLWTQTMNTLPDSSYLFPVKTEVDIFGNVVTLCVQSVSSVLDQKIYLRKFDTNGSIIWTQIFDNSEVEIREGMILPLILLQIFTWPVD